MEIIALEPCVASRYPVNYHCVRFDAEPATSTLRTATEYITNRYQPDTLMLKEIRMENWKSYQQSTLYLDPLTVLIGTNASGKSKNLKSNLKRTSTYSS